MKQTETQEAKMQKLHYTDNIYGSLTFDLEERYIEDDLDRDAIWEESGHDYVTQQTIYMDILGSLFEDYPGVEELDFRVRDFGAAVQLPDTEEWFYLEAGTAPAHIV